MWFYISRNSENIKHYKLTISEETRPANFGGKQVLDHGLRNNKSSGSHAGAGLTSQRHGCIIAFEK